MTIRARRAELLARPETLREILVEGSRKARAIAQDAAGFLWIGTQDGLARFDGYEFKVHRHDRNDRHYRAKHAAAASRICWRRDMGVRLASDNR